MLLVGTTAGLYEMDGSEPRRLVPRPVTCLASGGGRWWALADQQALLSSADGRTWDEVTTVDGGLVAHCLAAGGDEVLVGTSEAHLLRFADGSLRRDESFDAIPTRDAWYTPWGAPPDVRSLAAAGGGPAFVNVHVGGVWRQVGDGWDERVEVDDDTHQVVATDGLVLVAAAVGFGLSRDGGETFEWSTDGLHDTYARATALAGDTVLLTASSGPSTRTGAVYRRAVDGGPFEKAHDGLPEWFHSNVDTHCLAATGETAAFGTNDGDVYVSTDAGRRWERVATGMAGVRCVALA